MKIYTKTGDDGTTGLLYGGRADKNDLRIEAAGSIDEAVAALGLARATCTTPGLGELLLRLQRELFAAGAEIATAPDNWRKLEVEKGTLIDAGMVDSLEHLIDEHESRFTMPSEFIIHTCAVGSQQSRSRSLRKTSFIPSLDHAGESSLPSWFVSRI